MSDDDIEELKKLKVAIDSGGVNLFITQQVRDEFKRNREGKIAESLRMIKGYNLPNSYPRLLRGYDEFKLIRDAQIAYEKNLRELLEKLSDDISNKSLAADELIESLFSSATLLESEDSYDKAVKRTRLGNPPGKNGSHGDAINWELLLSECPDDEDLYLLSRDGDFISKTDSEKLSEFLQDEWKSTKEHTIHFYRSLSSFFKQQFPDIKLADELGKELAVKQLVESGNFASTHKAIAKLNDYSDFTEQQVVDMCNAALTNQQISWIKDDEDVQMFYSNILNQYEGLLSSDIVEAVVNQFSLSKGEAQPINLDEIPF